MGELSRMHCQRVRVDTPRLDEAEIGRLMAQLPGWTNYAREGEPRLEKSFRFADFTQALAFTGKLGRLADREDHHPAILTEWGRVTVTWWTHRIKGLHLNDFIMAARTDDLYAQAVAPTPRPRPGAR